MEVKEFKRGLAKLERMFSTDPINVECHNVVNCNGCSRSVFCSDCDNCYRCSHCVECSGSSNLTHCHRCGDCHNCSNCHECTSCISSAYLVYCRDLRECNYCFGCVGLSRKEFHILNEPYPRSEYFALTDKLGQQLHIAK
jgi:hypothetical protein